MGGMDCPESGRHIHRMVLGGHVAPVSSIEVLQRPRRADGAIKVEAGASALVELEALHLGLPRAQRDARSSSHRNNGSRIMAGLACHLTAIERQIGY